MHGLIFVTWEKYLLERFGSSLLDRYRAAIGETPATSPLTSRTYDDETLLVGVGAACELTHMPADTILREYGHYFIINGLTSHLCAYILTRVHSGRDLLFTMSKAHAQMRLTPDQITPPLFKYEIISSDYNHMTLTYDSPRKLCSVLQGAIEGAAERYGEQVHVFEHTCMKRGADVCRFELLFVPSARIVLQQDTPERLAKRNTQQQLTSLVMQVLPDYDGYTLVDLQNLLRQKRVSSQQTRPSVLLEALRHLIHAGLVASTANQRGDNLTYRRYWRAPTLER